MTPFQAMRLRKASSLAAVVPAGTYTKTATGVTATITLTFQSGGGWTCNDDAVSSGTWLTGTGTGANYWIRWTTGSGGPLDGGTESAWEQLSVNRGYNIIKAAVGTKTITATVEIATDSGGANVIASGTITLNATRDA